MSKDPEELELEALQRRLDDAFETTRPRRGFEDELWLRMQRKRPFGERLRDMLSGLVAGVREAPAIPIAAVAVLLVAVIGVGLVSSGLSPFSGRNHASLSAGAPQAGAGSSRNDVFGPQSKVPTPALHPGLFDNSGGLSVTEPAAAPNAPSDLYYGPANLVWSGSFATDFISAPVLIYTEPSAPEAQAATGLLGPQQGVTVQTRGSVPQLPREPIFIVTENSAGASPGEDPAQAADSFLGAHDLTPPWPNSVVVIPGPQVTRVVYQRAFTVQNGDLAYLVDWNGERYGLEVDIVNGRRSATGPLPLSLETVGLPLISNGDAAKLAVSEAPASTQSFSPLPTIQLDRVELVYALAIAGRSGFYEPAYLFSGQFTYNGQTYEKRVLVPLVAASSRS